MDSEPASSNPSSKRKREQFEEGDDSMTQPPADVCGLVGFGGGEADSEDDNDIDDDSDHDSKDGHGESINGSCEYEESDEPFPTCVAFDKDFAQVRQDLTSIPIEVAYIVARSGCESRRAQSCCDNALELAQIPRAQREKIALIGNTGAGKSSLLNSLLGMPNLARSMAAGESCTHVGTEYECSFPGQTKKLAAKVEYFDTEEINELLRRLLQDYNSWHCDRPEGMDDDEEMELKRLAITAFDTMRTLFCNKAEMSSPGIAHDFLYTSLNTSSPAIFALCSAWCAELLAEKEADEADHIEYLDADSPHELLEQLEPLVFSTSRLKQPSFWPLVKKVRIGTLDLEFWIDASFDKIRSCDTIWVVTKIDRAITDTTVDSLLSRYGKSYDMLVICTGVDSNVDPSLPAFLQSEGQSLGEYEPLRASEAEMIRDIKRNLKTIESKRAKLEGRNKVRDESKRRPLTEATWAKFQNEIVELDSKLQLMRTELCKVSQERYATLVDARNAFTIRRLKDEKKEYMDAGKALQVFCVSNKHYSALKGAWQISGPRLDTSMTGIPALRKHILQSAAPRLLQNVENYIDHRFTVFMKGLAMWVKSYSVEGSAELLAAVQKPQDQIQSIVQGYCKDLTTETDALVKTPITADLVELAKKATAIVESKKSWSWSTVRAFVRRDGCHRTSVVSQQNWNEQFLEGANQIVKEQWDELMERQYELGKQLREDLVNLIEGIETFVQEHPAHLVLPMERLKETFNAQRHGIEQACNKHQKAVKKEFHNIHLDLTQNRRSGYFTQAMAEAYEKCKIETGKGIKARTLATFETHLALTGKRSPFSVMCHKLTRAIANDAKAKNKILAYRTEDILKGVYRQFSEIVDQKIENTAEAELRAKFKVFLGQAEPMFEDVKAHLGRIKRRYGM